MTAPKTTTKPARKPATRKAAAPAAPAAPKPEVNYRVERIAEKDPSEINRAEAAWLVQVGKLDVTTMDPMDLAAKMVQLVAGAAHRAWQASPQAASVHATNRAK